MERHTTFYYDETFHDRRLSTKDGMLNAYSDQSYDGFVFSLLGTTTNNIDEFLNEYSELESRIKTRLGLSKELKSTTFSNKSFKYGAVYFNNDCKGFYFDFFDLLIKHNLLFQVGYISKTELLVHRFLQHVRLPFNVPYKSFVYSLSKLLEKNRLEYLFTNLLSDNKNNIKEFASKIIELLQALLAKLQGIKREEIEILVINNVIQILEYSLYLDGAPIDDAWNYLLIGDGVKNRIKETNGPCHIILDKEQSTYDAFVRLGIDCEQQDSENSIGVRAVDMFVGFVGRIIKSLKKSNIL